MNINQAFVLAAGYGTRMGEVGKHLPKPLWPIFETTLLGLQIHYIKSLGIEKIIVNIHHKHEKMKDYLAKNFPEVLTSYEENLLGSGGGVYKIINDGLIDLESPLALFNSDSFLMIEKKDWEGLAQATYEREVSTGVFLSKISKDSHYNNVTFDKNGLMLSIESGKKTRSENYTYSGFGVVFPDRLKKNEGELDFFTTVADYKN
ncbi:MAG: NTP transferase domain-containing protein, partial [Bacteriovoracaceae bacterium]|nr:NTP transferase domain-containing protein [Bacteriovoracaceae bacterium]